jgi:hypothetical protein
MRVLVATNQLSDYGGSELVAWEVAEWFAGRGDEVTVAAIFTGSPLTDAPAPFAITDDLDALDLSTFDLVWSQHDMVTRLAGGLERCAAVGRLPLVVMVALSPFERLEHVDAQVARAIGAEVWANSDETAHVVARESEGLLDLRRIHRFRNAAPERFWVTAPAPAPEVRRVLAVSNRMPLELRQAFEALGRDGIDVRIVGRDDDYVWLGPEDIAAADAVVTIGKTVVDAIAVGRPVYLYDRFGGGGWLWSGNWEHERFHNFSGRPDLHRRDVLSLVREIRFGYADAVAEIAGIRATATDLHLDDHLGPLRERALRHRGRRDARRLAARLTRRPFRAHLATTRRKSSASL